MSLKIYKPNQAAMTRWLSALGVAMLVLAGAGWLWQTLDSKLGASDHKLWVIAGVVVTLTLVLAGVFYKIFNKPEVVDFLIETEGEMRKVNWPPKNDTVKLTWIVIVGTFLMAGFLFVVDVVFLWMKTNLLMN